MIDFGDNLDFTPIPDREQDELTCNWDDIPLDSSNLVIKVTWTPIHMDDSSLESCVMIVSGPAACDTSCSNLHCA